MKGFAFLAHSTAGWIEKEPPHATNYDAVIRPLIVSPCTSDVHNVEINCLAANRILGHEGIGEIVELGAFVKDFKIGDQVAIPAVTPNWRTVASQRGISQHCNGLITGNTLSNSEDGLFSEFTLIRDADANLAHLSPELSPFAAVMAGDMMNTGCYGAELADVQLGDTVVVLGIGPVGLMAVAAAKLRGAARIIAVGSRPHCIEIARFYGATDVVNYKEGDPVRQVYDLTHHKGADCCICAGGDSNALGQAVSMIRWGGTVGNINYFTTSGTLPIPNVRWGFGMGNKTIRGGECPGGRARMEKMLALLLYHRIDPLPLITHSFSGFSEIETAFHLMAEKPADLIKTIVVL
ncbi:MAG: zinc-binding dehydrogenase [Evtepia sp.]